MKFWTKLWVLCIAPTLLFGQVLSPGSSPEGDGAASLPASQTPTSLPQQPKTPTAAKETPKISAAGQSTPSTESPASAKAPVELGRGVVIETVKKNSEAEKAGLQEGDILLRSARGAAQGEIESPFDLSWIEIEQAPRGAVTIEGLRGADKKVWTLGPGSWGIEARPNLREPSSFLFMSRDNIWKRVTVLPGDGLWPHGVRCYWFLSRNAIPSLFQYKMSLKERWDSNTR